MKWQMLNKILNESQNNTNSEKNVDKRIKDCSLYSAKKCNLYNIPVFISSDIEK